MDVSTIAISILVAVISATLSTFLAFKKFKTEKWWDKKANCYLAAVENLNQIIQCCDAIILARANSDDQRIQDQFNACKLDVEKLENIGSLLLSEEAQKNIRTLDNFLYDKELLRQEQMVVGQIREAVDECCNSIIKCAQRDLK